MTKVLLVFGTRPEAIKMAPVILSLKQDHEFSVQVCVTGQHREMLDQVLRLFRIIPEYDLNIMRKDQTLTGIVSSILDGLEPILEECCPDIILVHGDTTTSFAVAMAAFYKKIPVGHIEAGLRTGDLYSPWPEEGNRKLTAAITNLHFAPTERSKSNLIAEGVSKESIFITGNTVVDALHTGLNILENDIYYQKKITRRYKDIDFNKRIILVTGHRRENIGEGIINLCKTMVVIARRFEDVEIVFPVHMNPKVKEPVFQMLSGKKNIHLLEPLSYQDFLYLMQKSYCIVTDSGGIQEEAPSLGKPVVVTRDTTERPEAIISGSAVLVGQSEKKLTNTLIRLLENDGTYKAMATAKNPFGDGHASDRIINALKAFRKDH